MSLATALPKARLLKECMLDFGVPEVSIELQAGRPNPYDAYDALSIVSDMSHHTVSTYRPTSLTPVLALCKKGRSDVPGPLCNGYGGWDLCYRILCFSYANHPGAGGPLTVPRQGGGAFRIPKDSARRYAWGTEYEGGILVSDWDRVLRNPRNGKTMTFRGFMGRANAALQEFFNVHPGAHLEHSSWTSRKIDRLGYSRSEGIAEIERYDDAAPTPTDWFDMATEAQLEAACMRAMETLLNTSRMRDLDRELTGDVTAPIAADVAATRALVDTLLSSVGDLPRAVQGYRNDAFGPPVSATDDRAQDVYQRIRQTQQDAELARRLMEAGAAATLPPAEVQKITTEVAARYKKLA